MPTILVDQTHELPLAQQRIEVVERKGLGHPDSLCDALMEEISLALCRVYLATGGRVLHHNIDKGLLVAGRTRPALGGGLVLEPMRLVIGDRATPPAGGRQRDVGAIAIEAASHWLRQHLRFVDPARHLRFQNELKEGSPELTDLFDRPAIGANDTSAAVGYAPLTETERLVLQTERFLNSAAVKAAFPEAGEDVKVMGYRQDRVLTLTVALALVDRFIPDARTYWQRKQAIQVALEDYLTGQQHELDRITVTVNALDDPDRGEAGMYLTVLGTSAEGGDGGQVGRGNRVNGLITLNRPTGTEAAAGKNPVSHVGKIYSLLSQQIAETIHRQVPGVQEVYVWLGSQIGQPLAEPKLAAAQVKLARGSELPAVAPAITAIMSEQIAAVTAFTERLTRGELPVW